jgi:predicted nucleic acid-binding protein
MTGFLLDTNVVSEWSKRQPDPNLAAWMAGIDESRFFISVITVGELQLGIELAADGTKKKAQHQRDLGTLQTHYADRILPIDQDVAEQWGAIMAAARRRARPLPAIDCLIAATAAQHSLIVATRNVSHFQRAGVNVVNPFEA